MKKDFCTINVEEMKDGFRVEVKGEGIRERCMTLLDNCYSEEMKIMHMSCCASTTERTEEGCCIEIMGEEAKQRCKTLMSDCCTEDEKK